MSSIGELMEWIERTLDMAFSVYSDSPHDSKRYTSVILIIALLIFGFLILAWIFNTFGFQKGSQVAAGLPFLLIAMAVATIAFLAMQDKPYPKTKGLR